MRTLEHFTNINYVDTSQRSCLRASDHLYKGLRYNILLLLTSFAHCSITPLTSKVPSVHAIGLAALVLAFVLSKILAGSRQPAVGAVFITGCDSGMGEVWTVAQHLLRMQSRSRIYLAPPAFHRNTRTRNPLKETNKLHHIVVLTFDT